MTATTTELLIPALREARQAEAALVERFKAHAAALPAGVHRATLERHAEQARRHVHHLDERLSALQPPRQPPSVLGAAWRLTGQVLRMARLPLDVVVDVAMALPAVALRGAAGAQRLLRSAEDDYAAAATALAATRMGERIARQAHDSASSGLLGALRRDDEQRLEELARDLERCAEEVLAKAPAAADTQTPGARPQAPGEALPITDYGQLSALETLERLPQLSQAELAQVEAYERAHAARATVLSRLQSLRAAEPWPGYDSMNTAQIRTRLREADPRVAQRVLDYERGHRGRATVLTAARRLTA